ncbi:transcriptional regulator [Metabacillus fastidiosus]|uniref:Transcriptional regulator n=1 Tax=Metabacillus fastidiosus TaxID=1458 RepID=A0ABU6P472_9BACI|nr:transcriptional regulator [Metabacillus fastidiosus]
MLNAIEFGKFLKRIREEKGLTLREIQELSGVSNSYLSQLENGKRGLPSPDILKKIYQSLDVDYYELMEKAGYIVSGHEQIKELRNQLQKAYSKIRELENNQKANKITTLEKENEILRKYIEKVKSVVNMEIKF